MPSSEHMLWGAFLGLIVGAGITLLATAAMTADITCPKNNQSCRIIRCERIVEEGGKKTCERWGE